MVATREVMHVRFRFFGLMPALLLLLGATMLLPATASAGHNEGPTRVYFPTTGHTAADDFLSYWRHNGGLEIYGYPLSEVVTDPKTKLPTQYFERAVFEWHENNPAEWKVLLRRLGADLTKGCLLYTSPSPRDS